MDRLGALTKINERAKSRQNLKEAICCSSPVCCIRHTVIHIIEGATHVKYETGR